MDGTVNTFAELDSLEWERFTSDGLPRHLEGGIPSRKVMRLDATETRTGASSTLEETAEMTLLPPRVQTSGRLHASAVILLTLAVSLRPGPVEAQTNERLYENLDFRFDTPGARPVGMGKTFVSLADDATAALSNPAGLSNLLEQEFSVEFSGTQLRHERTAGVGAGDTQAFGSFVFTPSFFSYAIPLRRATLSFFRSSVQNFREDFEFGPRTVPRREAPEDGAFGAVAVQSESLGLGSAFVVNRFLSVGASLNLVTLDVASEARSGTRLNPRNGTNTIDSGLAWSVTSGVLFKPRRNVGIGAAYIGGATFPLETRLFGRFLWTQFDPD